MLGCLLAGVKFANIGGLVSASHDTFANASLLGCLLAGVNNFDNIVKVVRASLISFSRLLIFFPPWPKRFGELFRQFASGRQRDITATKLVADDPDGRRVFVGKMPQDDLGGIKVAAWIESLQEAQG